MIKNFKFMRINRTLVTLMLCALVLNVSARRGTQAMPTLFNTVNKAEMEKWVSATMKSMSQDERIAQLFVMTIDPRDDDATRARVKKYVADNKVGGLIYNESTLHEQVTITN